MVSSNNFHKLGYGGAFNYGEISMYTYKYVYVSFRRVSSFRVWRLPFARLQTLQTLQTLLRDSACPCTSFPVQQDLPWHCSFCECAYTTETEEMNHIVASHATEFTRMCGAGIDRAGMLHMYAEAITRTCQAGPPISQIRR